MSGDRAIRTDGHPKIWKYENKLLKNRLHDIIYKYSVCTSQGIHCASVKRPIDECNTITFIAAYC